MSRPFRPLRKQLSKLIAQVSRRHKQPARAMAERSAFRFEGLEPRMLLSADVMTVAAGSAADIEVRAVEQANEETMLQVVERNGEDGPDVLDEGKLNDLGSVVIEGSDEDDSLTIDDEDGLLSDSDLMIKFEGGDGNDTLDLSDSGDVEITFVGGEGDDQIIDAGNDNLDSDWTVDGDSEEAGERGSLDFSGVVEVQLDDSNGNKALGATNGGAVFSVTGEGRIEVNGLTFSGIESLKGRGDDTLSYADYDTGATVNLASGQADALAGDATGFGTLEGSDGNDSLSGYDDGSDVILQGLAGDDILEGGSGDDTLEGGTGANLLISTGGRIALSAIVTPTIATSSSVIAAVSYSLMTMITATVWLRSMAMRCCGLAIILRKFYSGRRLVVVMLSSTPAIIPWAV